MLVKVFDKGGLLRVVVLEVIVEIFELSFGFSVDNLLKYVLLAMWKAFRIYLSLHRL